MFQIKKIMVPIDFSDYSKKALEYATEFAQKMNSKIYLIYVFEPMIYPTDFSFGEVIPISHQEDLAEKAKSELKLLAESNISDKVDWEIIIKTGRPFSQINETAREIDADLIIIATHGHTGVEHIFFGSTAEKVVRKAPCPVLTLREPIKGFEFNKNGN